MLGCDIFQVSIGILVVLNNFKTVFKQDYPKSKYNNKMYILLVTVKIVLLLIAKTLCYAYRSRNLKNHSTSEQDLLLLVSNKRLLEIVENC